MPTRMSEIICMEWQGGDFVISPCRLARQQTGEISKPMS